MRERRARHWNRDFSLPESYDASVEPNRERLRRYLGVVDEREPVSMRVVRDATSGVTGDNAYAVGTGYRVYVVRW